MMARDGMRKLATVVVVLIILQGSKVQAGNSFRLAGFPATQHHNEHASLYDCVASVHEICTETHGGELSSGFKKCTFSSFFHWLHGLPPHIRAVDPEIYRGARKCTRECFPRSKVPSYL